LADDERNSSELPSGEQMENQSEVEELGQDGDEVSELENLVAQKDEELAKANALIIELEQTAADLDSEVATLKQSVADLEEKMRLANNLLDEAIAAYRDQVIRANPDIPGELITGDTIEAINQSLEAAEAVISKVRQGLEREVSMIRVPVGAPQRMPLDLSALSPREKIKYAIGGKK